jgi:hypothetical protein
MYDSPCLNAHGDIHLKRFRKATSAHATVNTFTFWLEKMWSICSNNNSHFLYDFMHSYSHSTNWSWAMSFPSWLLSFETWRLSTICEPLSCAIHKADRVCSSPGKVAHACNPQLLGRWKQEEGRSCLRPALLGTCSANTRPWAQTPVTHTHTHTHTHTNLL